jgi:hypothetical protein
MVVKTRWGNVPEKSQSGEIWAMNEWFDGDLIIPGAYVTDLLIEPSTQINREYIATVLRIPPNAPDPNRVTSYVDVKIDRMRVLLISLPIAYPYQYLHPFKALVDDSKTVIFNAHGPFLPPP